MGSARSAVPSLNWVFFGFTSLGSDFPLKRRHLQEGGFLSPLCLTFFFYKMNVNKCFFPFLFIFLSSFFRQSHCVSSLARLELPMQTRMASNSQKCCLCLSSTGVKGVHHYTCPPPFFFLIAFFTTVSGQHSSAGFSYCVVVTNVTAPSFLLSRSTIKHLWTEKSRDFCKRSE